MLRDLSANICKFISTDWSIILGFRSGRLNSDLISWVSHHPLVVGRPIVVGPNRFVVVAVKSVDLFADCYLIIVAAWTVTTEHSVTPD